MKRAGAAFLLLGASACGARTELGGVVERDASIADANADDVHDATTDEASPTPLCDYGTLVADAFGSARFWNVNDPIPAGHYRITYVDGCMKYSASQGWTVNAYADGPDTMYVVANQTVIVAPAPGTVGFQVNQGGFASFDACVAANLSDPTFELDFPGGFLGVQLHDDPSSDNVEGENGRNPAYRLTSCE